MTGAIIERGEVVEAGNGSYVVRSLDRPSITTLPIKAINDSEYMVGDTVDFYYFGDGTGKIICES